jgi:hypothetical protein
MTTAIKINDRVKIIDGGEVYSCYTEKFEEMGFKNTERNSGFERGDEGRVFAISDHPTQPNGLYAIVLDDGRECLISSIGIVLVEEGVHIKINDMVRIKNSGKTYTTHRDAFTSMGFKNKYENSAWNRGEVGRVFGISTHEYDKKTLYAVVHSDGRECLISAMGIELVNESVVDHATINSIITRLAKIESQLDQLAKHVAVPDEPKTAVEWFAEELATYDYDSGDGQLEIFISLKQFNQIKQQALLMETNQNCK